MKVSLASILVHVPASFGLMQLFSNVGVSPERPNGFGHAGVALATSIVALINFAALTYLMRRRIKRLNGRDIFVTTVKIVIASVVMSIVAYGTYRLLESYFPINYFWVQVVEVFVPMALAGTVFLLVAKLLGVHELEQAISAIRRKMRKPAR
jgi:putative peptidoglycan lipid II flippase